MAVSVEKVVNKIEEIDRATDILYDVGKENKEGNLVTIDISHVKDIKHLLFEYRRFLTKLKVEGVDENDL